MEPESYGDVQGVSGQNAVTNRAVYYLAVLCSATQRALGFRIGVGHLGSEFADGKSICVSGTIRTVVGKTRGQYQTKRLLHPLAKSFFRQGRTSIGSSYPSE